MVASDRGGVASWAIAWLTVFGSRLAGIAASHVDGLDQVSQAARLLRNDLVAIELDDGRHLFGGRVASLAGADLADVRDLASAP